MLYFPFSLDDARMQKGDGITIELPRRGLFNTCSFDSCNSFVDYSVSRAFECTLASDFKNVVFSRADATTCYKLGET